MQTELSLEPLSDPEQIRWNAVLECNPEFDGQFVYAVLTTGIYCRPSCKSRTQKRENVQFFETSIYAEKSGYRPCKRCAPQHTVNRKPCSGKIEKVCRILMSSSESPDLGELAKSVGMSRFHFQREFKRETGITPKAYINACRFDQVRLLSSGI